MNLRTQTTHEWKMYPIEFPVRKQNREWPRGIQRSRSQCMYDWKWFILHDCFTCTPIILKLHTQTPHQTRKRPIYLGSKGQRPRSQCIYIWKMFMSHYFYPLHPSSWNHIQTPSQWRICPIDFRIERLKNNTWITENCLCRIIAFPVHLSSWTSHTDSPWIEYVSCWCWGQQVKGQGHKAWITENCLCCIIAISLLTYVPYWFSSEKVKGEGHNALISENGLCRIKLLSLKFTLIIKKLPMSRGCALLIFGSKGQRPRSQCMNYRKLFTSHNCYPFTPIIMKPHTQTSHELRMFPIDFEV